MLFKLSKKQEETNRSLEKIERGESVPLEREVDVLIKVCYSLRLRLIEYADRPEILKQMTQRAAAEAAQGDSSRRDE